MTKREVVNILRRYIFITPAIEDGVKRIVFYVGNRKEVVNITVETKTVCELFDLMYESERDLNIKRMIRGIRSGEADYTLMEETHYARNSYYDKKYAIIEKLYNLCIKKGLVSFEEILMAKIA